MYDIICISFIIRVCLSHEVVGSIPAFHPGCQGSIRGRLPMFCPVILHSADYRFRENGTSIPVLCLIEIFKLPANHLTQGIGLLALKCVNPKKAEGKDRVRKHAAPYSISGPTSDETSCF